MFNGKDIIIEENKTMYEGKNSFSDESGISICLSSEKVMAGAQCAVPLLISLLKDGDARLRSFAARILGNIKAEEAVDELIKLLNDPDTDIRCDAAFALGCIGDKRSLQSLNECLKDEDGLVRLSTINALAEIGDNASVVPLIHAMTCKDDFYYDLGGDLSGNYRWDIQERAAEALGRIDDYRAVQALIDMLKPVPAGFKQEDDDAEYMLGAILKSLIRLGDRKGVEAAASYLNDSDIAIRRKAARAFCYAKDNSVLGFISEALVDEDSVVKLNALEAIENIAGEKDIIPVVLLLKDSDSEVRTKTIEVIGKIGGEKGIKHILPHLSDPVSSVRKKAAEVLGKLGNKESVEPLIRLLKDIDEGVVAEVILSIGKIGDRSGIAPLIAMLKDKKMTKVSRSRAILSLVKINSEEDLQAIADIAGDKGEDKELRLIAIKSLKNIGRAEPLLLSLLNDEIDAVKKEAAIALSDKGNDSGIGILLSLLKDKDCDCIADAIKAIKNIKSEGIINMFLEELKNENASIRCSAVKAISELAAKDAVEPLIGLLKDDEKEVRREAVIGLGRLRDKSVIKPFVAALFDYEFFDDLRHEIALSLKKIDAEESAILLLNIINNKSESRNNRWTAMEALSVIYAGENNSLAEDKVSYRGNP